MVGTTSSLLDISSTPKLYPSHPTPFLAKNNEASHVIEWHLDQHDLDPNAFIQNTSDVWQLTEPYEHHFQYEKKEPHYLKNIHD